jgi:hypothetical protein
MQQQPDFIKLKVGKSELLCKESANAITEQLLKIILCFIAINNKHF